MTHRLTTSCAKNYCNRTLIVKVIVENVVTCFLGGHKCISCTQLLVLWHRSITCETLANFYYNDDRQEKHASVGPAYIIGDGKIAITVDSGSNTFSSIKAWC